MSFVYATGLRQCSLFRVPESLGTRDRILLPQIWDFPFPRLLRLAGSRWRYSIPPPHGLLLNQSQAQSQNQELLYSWRFTANQFILAPSPLRLTARIFLLNWTPAVTVHITSYLRGWVCHLKLLLVLASSFILGSGSRGTRDHILLSQIRDFHFYRLIRLAGLRWRYSTPPPHGNLSNQSQNQSQSHTATDGQSVSPSVKPRLGLMTRYLLLFDSYGLVFVGRHLWREDGSVFCICSWPLPVQSFSYFTVSDLRHPLSSPPTTRRVTVEVCDPITRISRIWIWVWVMLRPTVSLSWNKSPIWSLQSDFITVRPLGVCWFGTLSMTRGREVTTSNSSLLFYVYSLLRKRVNFVATFWFSHIPISWRGNVPSELLSSNELTRLSGVVSQYKRQLQ
jgi:hypothetical protein